MLHRKSEGIYRSGIWTKPAWLTKYQKLTSLIPFWLCDPISDVLFNLLLKVIPYELVKSLAITRRKQ